jgi:MFS family permease
MSNDIAVTVDTAEGGRARAHETAALKLALISLAGASVEYYDFLLYGTAAALVFPAIFFPATLPPFIGLMASFSTFGVAFLARPVGAVLFGHMGDRMGRKAAFALALCIMGTATMLIGFLPSYHTAGIFSPIGLVLLRLTQGFALGCQWGGSVLIATESAPRLRRGLYGSFPQAGIPLGALLATSAFLVVDRAMSSSGFIAYGWRIPFLLSILLVGLGAFIHLRVEDTAAFRKWQQTKSSAPDAPECAVKPMRSASSPVLEAWRLYPRLILVAAGSYYSSVLAFYILSTYVLAYATSAAGLHLPRSTMLTAGLLAHVIGLPAMVVAGAFSDRYGRRRIFMTGVALVGIWVFLLFPMIETRSLLWIIVAHFIGAVLLPLAAAPQAAMFAELFSTAVRYSAVSLAYQIAAIAGGGLTPIIATGLYARYHSNIWVSVYVACACAVSFVCVKMLRETRGIGLDESPQPTGARVVST